jgi:tetratricopeptide (TPR) repeat protein
LQHRISRMRFGKPFFSNLLEVRTKETMGQLWGQTEKDLGITLAELGRRLPGEDGVAVLKGAVAASKLVLGPDGVMTRECLPQFWASSEMGLGLALFQLGVRLDRENGLNVLGEAADSCKLALLELSRSAVPQFWAEAQANLCGVLSEEAVRAGEIERTKLLNEAVAACQNALEVRTLKGFPYDWLYTTRNLANTYFRLKEWDNAAKGYASILAAYPDDQNARGLAITIYHERTFDFLKDFELNDNWVRRHPNDLSALADFAEDHFTTGRFQECETRIATLLSASNVGAGNKAALRVIQIANLLALAGC